MSDRIDWAARRARHLHSRAHGSSAVGDVFDSHFGWVSKTLERFGVREAEAPDVTQEVFVVVHAHLASYDAPAATVALRDCIPHREAVASAGTAST